MFGFKLTLVALPPSQAAGRLVTGPRPLTGLAIDPHQWKWDWDMDDTEAKSAGPIDAASDLRAGHGTRRPTGRPGRPRNCSTHRGGSSCAT
ncbi:hypothetical protein CN203_17610 [Sinorhizobium meliloti]|nr:hypothetical protein CN222_29780 [Sinorhizobium meliloti]RVH76243.1 hypothetical protein CN203_17500 [Sinorhizobium meliloti]RVH76256.1 hypothetical protein CN203_17610 [Sinorhizobium meliloti]RVI12198.1 hypothetical protein CN206_12035 [Sinorhizobium meliloti]RVM32657.1 hypothetical protein CN129_21540 [Sinorhizobium meliloti]